MSEDASASVPAVIEPETPEQALVFMDAARRALDAALDFQQVRHCRSAAVAAAAYAREAKDKTLVEKANRLRLEAERRAGAMLIQAAEAGDRMTAVSIGQKSASRRYNKSHDDTSYPPTLKDIGISKIQSSQWQQLARLPDMVFADAVNSAAAGDGNVTAPRVIAAALAAQPAFPSPIKRAQDGGRPRKSHAQAVVERRREVLEAIEAALPATPIVTYAKTLRRFVDEAPSFTDAELQALAELRPALDAALAR